MLHHARTENTAVLAFRSSDVDYPQSIDVLSWPRLAMIFLDIVYSNIMEYSCTRKISRTVDIIVQSLLFNTLP